MGPPEGERVGLGRASMIDFPQSDFWDYSIALYARPEVEAACLGLQNRQGADVNLVLFCLWVAASGRGTFQGAELEDALAAVGAWRQQVVERLRKARGWLKGDVGAAPSELASQIRRAVLSVELDSEHVEQLMLVESLKRPAGGGDPEGQARAAIANLRAYFAAIGASLGDADRADARVLLAAAFPELPGGLMAKLSK